MEVVFSPPVCVEDIYIFIFLAKGCRGGLGPTNAPIPAGVRIFSAQFQPLFTGENARFVPSWVRWCAFLSCRRELAGSYPLGPSSESFPGACVCVRGTLSSPHCAPFSTPPMQCARANPDKPKPPGRFRDIPTRKRPYKKM
jgi:hypothetical protein